MSVVGMLYLAAGLALVGTVFAIRGIWLALRVVRKGHLLLPIDRIDTQLAALASLLAAILTLAMAVLLTLLIDQRLGA